MLELQLDCHRCSAGHYTHPKNGELCSAQDAVGMPCHVEVLLQGCGAQGRSCPAPLTCGYEP